MQIESVSILTPNVLKKLDTKEPLDGSPLLLLYTKNPFLKRSHLIFLGVCSARLHSTKVGRNEALFPLFSYPVDFDQFRSSDYLTANFLFIQK